MTNISPIQRMQARKYGWQLHHCTSDTSNIHQLYLYRLIIIGDIVVAFYACGIM